ncbi:MAG: PTS glucitol/sorbitol transporter subunit IIA [Ktedonobacteraceae bacterium]
MASQSLKYQGVIQSIGSMVPEFLPHGILIFFGETAPEELRDTALVHNGTQLVSELVAGDYLKFSPSSARDQAQSFHITAVGESANTNLAQLGHVVIHFDGATEAKLPGAISVEPTLEVLPAVGTTFEFFRLEE